MAALQVLCSLVGWLLLYAAFRRAFGPRGAEWSCRLVALSHGVLIVLLTAFVLFVDGPWPFTHAGTANTPLQVRSMAVCLGYFLFDLGWCVRHGAEGFLMLAHHAGSVAGLLLALLMGASGCETCAVVLGSELTNPLLQSRWFLRRLGRGGGALAAAVDLLFVSLFAGVRVGVGGALLYCELTSPRTTLAMKLGGVAMYALAWVFMLDIARYAHRKSRERSARRREEHPPEGGAPGGQERPEDKSARRTRAPGGQERPEDKSARRTRAPGGQRTRAPEGQERLKDKGQERPEDKSARRTRAPGGQERPEDKSARRTRAPGGQERPEDKSARRTRAPEGLERPKD